MWLPPKLAAILVAWVLGRLDIADDLIRICMRESRCEPIGIHDGDAKYSRRGWRGQVRLRHIDPVCQPYRHRAWATRGSWGLSAASHWRYFPRCYRPQWLDVPIVSAWIAGLKFLRACDGRRDSKRSKWC